MQNYNADCSNKHYNILVIDDSVVFNQTITDALVEHNQNVTQAYTLQEAKEIIENQEFDFIFLDLILPDGEGDQLLDSMSDELRSKVIVLSGDTDMQRRSYIFESGILDYFSKANPIHLVIKDIKELLCTIEFNAQINILIVDDSTFMRKVLKNILIAKRFNIFEAKNAQEGLEILQEKPIHLLLLDYEMPGMNGAAMLEKIKEDVVFLELPVIMLSGSDDKNFVSRVLKHGASDVIKKPFVTEELLLKCDLQVKQYINVQNMKQKEEALQVALQQTKETAQHKAMFLANMSHEIRTPLNAIMGFVDLMHDDEKDEKKLNYLETIQKSGHHLLELINDILDFSKIENNKLDINKEVFSLEELYDVVISLVTHLMKEKNITFITKYNPSLPQHVDSDFLRIKQVLLNLISNAIKFTPQEGEVSFEIDLSENQQFIQFSVKDTGIGIEASKHEQIFDMFTQAENSTTKNYGGTGLGLSISSKLVSMLEGDIWVESELEKGSNFYFTIPIVSCDESKVVYHRVKKENKQNKVSMQFNHHVLLVEDNKTNQQFMAILLKKLGLSFDIADDGLQAIDRFNAKKYDLILMDENMPNMSGIEATKVIRKLQKDKALKYTPIIALTANAIKGDRERFINAGMNEYLSKPIDKERFIEVLSLFLLQDEVYEAVEKPEKHTSLPRAFIEQSCELFEGLEKAITLHDYEQMIKCINLIKLISLKHKIKDVFAICLNIEQSAKESDLKSCENYFKVFTRMLGD